MTQSHETVDLFFHELRLGFLEPPLEIRNHALERTPAVAVILAVENDVLLFFREIFKRRIKTEAVPVREITKRAPQVDQERFAAAFPCRDRAAAQGFRPVGQYDILVDFEAIAETVPAGAGAIRAVERKKPRLKRLKAD